jgi:hypothetical protein
MPQFEVSLTDDPNVLQATVQYWFIKTQKHGIYTQNEWGKLKLTEKWKAWLKADH